MAVYGCKDLGTVLEIKNAVVVVALIFLNNYGLWEFGRFKLFLYRGINTVHKFLCMHNIACKRAKSSG